MRGECEKGENSVYVRGMRRVCERKERGRENTKELCVDFEVEEI